MAAPAWHQHAKLVPGASFRAMRTVSSLAFVLAVPWLAVGCGHGNEGKKAAALAERSGESILVSAGPELAGGTSELFGGGGDLYLVPVSGGEPILIPGTEGYDSPSWRPDGKMLAASDCMAGCQIKLIKPDGGGQVLLPIQAVFGVAWSPDGRRLAYSDENSAAALTIASAASGKPITTLPRPGNSPDWSPDGKRIAFQSSVNNGLRIFVVDVDGRNEHQLTTKGGVDGDTEPVWSPDGTRIAFVSDRDGDEEIEVMKSDGSHRTSLTSNDLVDWHPTWSPDGTQIAFVQEDLIYVMNADGTGERALIGLRRAVITKLAWQPVSR
jgi:Tol biopolymer transport system component